MGNRRRLIAGVIASLAVVLTGTAPLHAAEPTAAGLWEQTDGSVVGGWFLLFERDGLYNGALVRSFLKPGETPILICARCPDDQKNAPMQGLIIIKGMQRKGLTYENGSILDPRDGTVYKAKLELSPDAKNLTVRGFLGIELFGQSQVWKRLPDNALARNEVPETLQAYLPATAPSNSPAGGKPGNGANPKQATGTTPKNALPPQNAPPPPLRR